MFIVYSFPVAVAYELNVRNEMSKDNGVDFQLLKQPGLKLLFHVKNKNASNDRNEG